MTDKQPEALRLADRLEADAQGLNLGAEGMGWEPSANNMHDAATELRRLYANNTDLLNALRDCAAWMEDLRASGDAGNWDWEADEYTRAMDAIAKATGEQQ